MEDTWGCLELLLIHASRKAEKAGISGLGLQVSSEARLPSRDSWSFIVPYTGFGFPEGSCGCCNHFVPQNWMTVTPKLAWDSVP